MEEKKLLNEEELEKAVGALAAGEKFSVAGAEYFPKKDRNGSRDPARTTVKAVECLDPMLIYKAEVIE